MAFKGSEKKTIKDTKKASSQAAVNSISTVIRKVANRNLLSLKSVDQSAIPTRSILSPKRGGGGGGGDSDIEQPRVATKTSS